MIYYGWEPFYLRHFKIGLCFSVMGLIEELCNRCQIHLSKLTLMAKRLLLCVDRLKEKHPFEFSVEDFFYS